MSDQPKFRRTHTMPANFKRLVQFVDVRSFLGDTNLQMELVEDVASLLNRELERETSEKVMRQSTMPANFKIRSPIFKKAKRCVVCDDKIKKVAKVCYNEDCELLFCKSCLGQTFEVQVNARKRQCPILKCPNPDCGQFLVFSRWREYVSAEVATEYEKNASMLLSLKCGSCHTLGSLMIKDVPKDPDEVEKNTRAFIDEVQRLSGDENAQLFASSLEEYKRGQMKPEQFYDVMIKSIAPDNLASELGKDLEQKKNELAEARKAFQNWKITDDEYLRTTKLLVDTKEQLDSQQHAYQRLQDGEEVEPAAAAPVESDNDDDDESPAAPPSLRRQSTMQIMSAMVSKCENTEERAKVMHDQISMLSDSVSGLEAQIAALEAKARLELRVAELESGVNHVNDRFKRAAIDTAEAQSGQLELVLHLLDDVERRSSLHLRMMRVNPSIKSLCCQRSHCFRCQLRDGHPDGTTCEQYMASNFNGDVLVEIRLCPTCSVAIVKAEGCNSINCYCCGNYFDWAAAKVLSDYSKHDES